MSDNWKFVIASYVLTWIVIIGYAIRVHSGLSRARAEYDAATANSERPQ